MRYYSNSEIQTWLRCRRKHYLGYQLGYQPARERLIPSRLRGNLGHAALELYYASGDNPLDFIQSERVRIVTQYVSIVEVVDQDDLKDINSTIDLVHAMLEGYLQWVSETGADQDLEVVATEREVIVPLGDKVRDNKAWHDAWQDIALIGKLDAKFRSRSTGFTSFMDHKTVGDLVSLPKWAVIHPQILFYELLERLTQADGYADGGIFNMLRSVKRTGSSKPPFYDRWTVRHNPAHLRSFWTQVLAHIIEIELARTTMEEGGDHQATCPPSPRGECAWDCEFFSVCPMMDDGSDYQHVLADAYKVGNPLDRYRSIEKG